MHLTTELRPNTDPEAKPNSCLNTNHKSKANPSPYPNGYPNVCLRPLKFAVRKIDHTKSADG